MPLIYKTLFEVKLMHEFYLTEKDGSTIFENADQKDRINYLLNQFSIGRHSINKDLEFKFPEKFKSTYDGYLKLLMTYSGFKVAIRVRQNTLADNSIVYKPVSPLPDNFNIYVQLFKKNKEIDGYTNRLISSSLPLIYFFSNENTLSSKAFPFLTNVITPFNAGNIYQQGELASFGVNDTREYYKDDLGDQWQQIIGAGFTNENDRLLVPVKFYYSLNDLINITQAEFTLKDKDGYIIKTILVNNADPFQKAFIDFSDKKNLLSLTETSSFKNFIFSLEVSASNGYKKNHTIIFSDALYNTACWGVVHVTPKPTNGFFNLLAGDGYLFKRKNAAGIWNEAPVYEIPVKSRFTYWRYINDKGKEIKLIPDLTDYLFKEDRILISKRPRAIAKSFFLLKKEGSTDTKYVPNPTNYDLNKDNKERLCFDVKVAESELFPVLP